MTNLRNMLMMAGDSETSFQCDAVTFDGTNDYLSRGDYLTNNGNTKEGIMSFWIYFTGDQYNNAFFNVPTSSEFFMYTPSDAYGNILQGIIIKNTNGDDWAIHCNITNGAFSAGWNHVLISWKCAASGAFSKIYVNDVLKFNSSFYPDKNVACLYAHADYYIGKNFSAYGNLEGYLAEFYMNFVDSLDLSVVANRRKFITSGGKPVDLGSDGSTPTGSSPIIYLSVRPSDAATVFANNKGYGGNFVITGALAISGSSPSD